MTRREVMQGGGTLAVALFLGGSTGAPAAIAMPAGEGPAFLTRAELDTLRALVDRFVPGKPETPDHGAAAAGCAEGIDALLGAFAADPPRIYAGGPFSDRAGSPVNHFEDFVPLDPYEEKAWRLRIEGSQGDPELEFNGPVKGLQAIYRAGLAALDGATAPRTFAALTGLERELILRTTQNGAIKALIDVAFPHTLELIYGAPEYGGNRAQIGWRYTNYAGDVQPRGWTRAQIEQPDPKGLTELLPELPVGIDLEKLLALLPLAGSPEMAHVLIARSGGSLAALEAELAPLAEAGVDLTELRRRLLDAG